MQDPNLKTKLELEIRRTIPEGSFDYAELLCIAKSPGLVPTLLTATSGSR